MTPYYQDEFVTLYHGRCEDVLSTLSAGSGTTLRAAKDAGVRSIGIEISERFCEMAARRLDQAVLDFGGAA